MTSCLRHTILLASLAGLTLVGACSSGDGLPVPLPRCLESADCTGGQFCSEGRCREACDPFDPCSGVLGRCDADLGLCVQCLSSADCGGADCLEGGWCDATACASDRDCRGGEACMGGFCEPIGGECVSDGDCRGGEGCVSGECVPLGPSCANDGDCSGGERCSGGVCVPIVASCANDGDCGSAEQCLLGVCVPTTSECTSDGDCAGGERCDAGTCVPIAAGCTGDGDCAGGERCDAGTCVPIPAGCRGDGDCAGGERCDAGECVPVDPPTGSLVVNLTWDNENDMDLHVLRPGTSPTADWFDERNDCHWLNRTPEWGAVGPPGNPSLTDVTSGFGPERFEIPSGVEAGRYHVGVHSFCSRALSGSGTADTPSEATIEVQCGGETLRNTVTLDRTDRLVVVMRVDFPSCAGASLSTETWGTSYGTGTGSRHCSITCTSAAQCPPAETCNIPSGGASGTCQRPAGT